MTCRVLVCDDEPQVAREWMAEIRLVLPSDAYELQDVPSNDEIRDAIHVLLRRRTALREDKQQPKEACLFDQADVLVIDYDLLHVDENNTRYTGEGVARLARVFSTCGILVVLNQYSEAQFDLGLRGHMESFADLNVDGGLIGQTGLWRQGPWTDLRPWHWPVLFEAAGRFERRVQTLSASAVFGQAIVATLGMTAADASRLSDTAFGFLAPKAERYEQLAETTFRDFIKGNSAALDTRDGEALVERDPDGSARIAASRIAKWLEREVLGPQDVLVDVPHLLQRCPYLLAGDMQDLDAWNNAVLHGGQSLKDAVPADAWFEDSSWLGHPALWWQRLESSDVIRRARTDFDFSTVPEFVFMEDVSRFGPIEEATEFRAGFHNSFDRRYIRNIDGIRYSPQRRLAFGG